MLKEIRARIVHTKADACSCGILLERVGWPSVYCDFFLDRGDEQTEGEGTARFEAAGFGRIGKHSLKLQNQQPVYSGPLHCIGEPDAKIRITPVGRRSWAEVEKCQDIQLSVQGMDESVQSPDAQAVRGS